MAGIYTPDQLRIKPPPGGFQQGGWYEGRQYWNGTFSDPGVIHPWSNQIGAGQEVSKEVVQQTNPANWDYLQKLKQQPQPTPVMTVNQPPFSNVSSISIGSTSSTGNLSGLLNQIQQPTIDIKGIYESLFNQSGIKDLQNKLSQLEKDFNTQMSKINDNPFLSEANRVGRARKLTEDFQREYQRISGEIATKKADIETQLNIQLKQFDINSEQARQAREQLNFLLQSGLLAGATDQDIANITKATGISSEMIKAAIQKQKEENRKTVVKEWDDGVNQGFVVIDALTGEIINKQTIAASKPSKSGGGLTPTQVRNITGQARDIIRMIDEQYWTISGKLYKRDKEDWGGDKKLSAQEYLKAVEDLMTKTGLSKEEAASYVSNAMKEMGYSAWIPSQNKSTVKSKKKK